MACGCLLANPPDHDEGEDHWPVFVRTVPAGAFQEVDLDGEDFPAGTVNAFGAVVRDGNLGQDLTIRWFLDYVRAPDAPGQPFCGRIQERVLRPSGVPERVISAPISTWHNLLVAGRCHRLTLVVTDGEFVSELEGCAAVEEPAHRVWNDWWLGVYDDDTPLGEVDFNRCRSVLNELDY